MTNAENGELLLGEILFEVETPLGFSVRTTASYWTLISTVKHPVMRDKLKQVCQALIAPNEIRVSKHDSQVYLFYREEGEKRWVCAVTKQTEDTDAFLITAYRTSAIKGGKILWQK
jgi:hypothetical protein